MQRRLLPSNVVCCQFLRQPFWATFSGGQLWGLSACGTPFSVSALKLTPPRESECFLGCSRDYTYSFSVRQWMVEEVILFSAVGKKKTNLIMGTITVSTRIKFLDNQQYR